MSPKSSFSFFRYNEPQRATSGKIEILGSITILVPEQHAQVLSTTADIDNDRPVRIGSPQLAAEYPRQPGSGAYMLTCWVMRRVSDGRLTLRFPEEKVTSTKAGGEERWYPKWYIRSNERRNEICAWVQELLDGASQ